jgi:hypothetical protein
MKIYGSYDVVVVGGGASGCAAAIAAARAGAKVILIEALGALGGMMNVSGPPGWAFSHLWNGRGETIMAGLVEETHHRLEKEGHALPYPAPENRDFNSAYSFVDPDWWGLLIFEMLRENKVTLLLHSLAVDVMKNGDNVEGVIVENTNGRMCVMGKVIIEATGEGDIAVRAGVPYTKVDRTKEEIDPPSITFHMDGIDWDKVTAYMKENVKQFSQGLAGSNTPEALSLREERILNCDSIIDLVKAGVMGAINYDDLTQKALAAGDMERFGDLGHFFTPRQGGHIQAIFQHTAQVEDCDTTDITEWSYGEMEARRQAAIAIKAIRKYLPGYENAYLTRVTSCMRTREGRHMIGDYQMQAEDAGANRKFPDVIAKAAMAATRGGPFHTTSIPGGSINRSVGERFTPSDGGSYDIPYRCLVPKNVEGMLLAGKLVSVSEDFKRDQLPDNIISGQAAGVAAAICVKHGISPRELEKDVTELQEILVQQGAILTGTH